MISFLGLGMILQFALHVGDHFIGGIERASRAARLDVSYGFGQPGINETALGRSVFVIGIRKLGAVNNHFRRDEDCRIRVGIVTWPFCWILVIIE